MFKQFPLRCCKNYCCDCCLNENEISDRVIAEEIRRIRERNLYERKVILLGNTEAGKSTFLKQMKFIHRRGLKINEKLRFIPFINQQILGVARCLCQAMQTLCIPYEKSQNEEHAHALSSSHWEDNESVLSPQIVEAIKHIWMDKGVQLCYCRRREYQLTDSAKYFLDNIDRICGKNYIPRNDDILRVRIPTMTIVEENFQFSRVRLQIVDVSGQRGERKKWIHCFDNVTTVIFLASLIEYDQYVADDPSKQNLMEESLALFRIILSSDYFRNASVILFLNKIDLLQERLVDKPLRCTFPEFNGADDDVEAAKEFIKNKYLSFVPDIEGMKRDVSPHFTCSVDKKNIRIVYDEVKGDIFDKLIDFL